MIKYLLLLMLPVFAFSQIPNPGFEDWTGINPDNWWVNNLEGVYQPVSKSTDAHSGTYAIKGEVIALGDYTYGPLVYSGNSVTSYIPIDQKYTKVKGYFKFVQQNPQDSFEAVAIPVGPDSITAIGIGGFTAEQSVNSYTPFEINLEYYSETEPGYIQIYFVISYDDSSQAGSYFLIDDLSLSTEVTALEPTSEVKSMNFNLKQNYPNPFNPSTKIDYQLPQNGFVKLVVYDNNGREIKTLVNGTQSAGSYSINFDGSNLPSGIYFYRLSAGSFTETKRMLLIK